MAVATPAPLAAHGIELLPDDAPETWTSRLRTGLATLAAESADDALEGIAVLGHLFPGGPASAGLSERDLWARLLLRSGDVAGALAEARARQAVKDSTLPRLLLVEALLAAGDPPAAAMEGEGIRSLATSGSAAPGYAQGLLAQAAGDLAGADAAFAEALAVRPDHVPSLRGRAHCAAAAGDMEAATGLLRDAVTLAGADARPGLLRELARLLAAAGDPAGAEEASAGLAESLGALAARLSEELAAVRAAPRRRISARGPRDASGGAVQPADDALLQRVRVELDEVAPEELTRALFEHFGHSTFRTGQAAVLRSVLSEGRDTLALMQTGAGKSLCFQLPAVLLPGVVLVVSPLVALMADQLAGLADVPALAGRATLINSTLPADELESRLAALANGAYSLVYMAPERLRQSSVQRALRQAGVSLLAIDEAHCLCLWGHDFRTEYLAVGSLARTLEVPRILAVTATATPAMQREIAESLGRPLAVVSTGVLRENLFLEVRKLSDLAEKRAALVEFVRADRGSGIVYATSRDNCERLSRDLRHAGVSAGYYHAGLTAPERQRTQDAFMAGRLRVLCATVAFGMGVNKRDVRFIVHFNPARSLEAYTQEAGRAGRDGRPAHCLLLATTPDKATLTRHANEDHLSLDTLRRLYGRVRSAVRAAGGGPIDASALSAPADAPDEADTAARIGLSALERAGFLTRGLDVPRQFDVLLRDAGHDERLSRLDLAPGRQRTIGTGTLAAICGTPVEGVEDLLAGWQHLGALDYRPGRRGLTLRLVEPPPPGAAEQLERLLATYEAAAAARATAMAGYLETSRCRNGYIARHFGEPHAPACGRCDVCAPGERRTASPPPRRTTRGITTMEPRQAALRLVGDLPFSVGRSGLAKILHGSSSSAIGPDRCALHGVLGGMTDRQIVSEIDALLDEGLLALREQNGYRVVALTDDGAAVLGHV